MTNSDMVRPDDSTLLLAIDTSLGACSAAVLCGGGLGAAERQVMARGQAEALPAMVDRVLAAVGVAHRDLDLVAVTAGPGSFTGLRVGLAFAQGLALGLDIPAIGIGSLEALAAGLPEAGLPEARLPEGELPILAALDARRDRVFCQRFDARGRPASPAEAMGIDAVGADTTRYRVVGSATDLLVARAPDRFVAAGADPDPDARIVARLAWARAVAGDLPTAFPTPIYLSAPHVTIPGGH